MSDRTPWIGGRSHPARRRILAVLCLSLLIVVIDNTVLNTALPTLARDLHAGTGALQWITDAYSLTFAALLITAGALGDRYGRRRALIGGLAAYAAGSLGAALAGGTAGLIAWRVIMGAAAAFVMPATLSILNAVFPAEERAQAIAVWSAVVGVAVVVGPTLGGFLLAHFAWGSVFLVNIPLVAVALVLVGALVPEIATERTHSRLDGVGVVTSIVSMLSLVDAVIEAPDRGWTAPRTLGEVAIAAFAFAAFVIWEARVDHPLIDVRVFTNRAFSAASGALAMTFFALFGTLFALTQYLQLVHGYSTLAAGVRALPFAAAMAAVSPLSSVLAGRVGVRLVVPVGLAVMAGGLLWLSDITAATGYPHVALAVIAMGAGMGLIMAPASESIMTALPQHQAGAGSAINDTVREVGGALGVAVIGSLVSASYRSHLHLAGLPAGVTRAARGSIAAADKVAAAAGPHAGAVTLAAHQAYSAAMASGLRIAALAALAGAVAAAVLLPTRRPAPARPVIGAAVPLAA